MQSKADKSLNVSSTASLLPEPLQAVYYATKDYVTSFSNAITEELHDTSVTLIAFLPGATETDFGKRSGMDKTELFNQTADARTVAQEGGDGMLEGKLNVMADLTVARRIMMASIPLTPQKILLPQIRKMQEVKED